jgi:glycosyltransferase involved in cell wall biosynthesis
VTFDSYRDYIAGSSAEFSVCKSAYVSTNSGWFSDRSAAYMASGRPVVMQETGFSQHLPCGEGLFAPRTVDEAAAAMEEIRSDYRRHSKRAREIAAEHLDARKVLTNLLARL